VGTVKSRILEAGGTLKELLEPLLVEKGFARPHEMPHRERPAPPTSARKSVYKWPTYVPQLVRRQVK